MNDAVKYNRLALAYEQQEVWAATPFNSDNPYFQAVVKNGENLLPYILADIVTGDDPKRWQCAAVRELAATTVDPVPQVEPEHAYKGTISEQRNKQLVIRWALEHLIDN